MQPQNQATEGRPTIVTNYFGNAPEELQEVKEQPDESKQILESPDEAPEVECSLDLKEELMTHLLSSMTSNIQSQSIQIQQLKAELQSKEITETAASMQRGSPEQQACCLIF